jgi:hypothetical protein
VTYSYDRAKRNGHRPGRAEGVVKIWGCFPPVRW